MKNTRFITPVGEANFPYLNKPDTKFDPDGVYRVQLILEDDPDFQALITKLTKILDEFETQAKQEGKKIVGRMPLYETEDDTGRIYMKFKQKAFIRPKKGGDPIQVKIGLFDKHNRPLADEIGRGSNIKICFEAIPYHSAATRMIGLSFRIVAVQVRDLKTRDNFEDGSSFGFDSEADGDVPFDDLEEDNPSDF